MESKGTFGKTSRTSRSVLTILIALLVLVIGGATGYNIYRHPDTFRHKQDNSLNENDTIALRDEILAKDAPKILVAYFSYSGTTRNTAERVVSLTGGTLFEIKTVKTYANVYTESNREIRKNERPELSGVVPDMEQYDIPFVGFPVWWHATPAPVNTFLESYDLAGKLIIPFCTSGGSEI